MYLFEGGLWTPKEQEEKKQLQTTFLTKEPQSALICNYIL